LQALGLSFLLALVAAVVFWFFALSVPGRRRVAIREWRRDLSVIADARRDFLDRRISSDLANASFVATFPSIRALVSSAPHESSGEESVPYINAILSDFRNVYGEHSISICDVAGAVLVSSDGPSPGADAVALAREAANTGKLRVDLVREPDGFIGFVVAAPVRESLQNAETGGAVLVVGNAEEEVFDLLRQPFTAETGEAVLVRRDGDSALYLSPLRLRPDAPLTFRRSLNVPGFTARGALEGDLFGSFVDYRGAKVFAAVRKLKLAPWGLVVKVDEDEALAVFREDVLRRGLTWGGLLLALIAAAFGLWRALVASHEVALTRGEARFGALVEQTTDAIFLVGNDGRVLRANRAAELMYGWTRDELLSMHAADVRASGTRDALRHDMEIAAVRGNLLVETRHRRADGSEFPVEVNIGRVKVGDETVFLSIVRDITDRKRAAEDLAKSEIYFRSLIENSLDVTAVLDPDGCVRYASPSVERIFGYKPEEFAGRSVFKLIHQEDRANAEVKFHRVFTEETPFEDLEFRIRHRDGSWRIHSAVGKLLPKETGLRGLILNVRDLTESKQLESQLRQAQKMEAVGRLAGGVAHDFNNLLTVIQGYAELLGASLANDPERRESVVEIVKAAERAAALTRQLLAFSRRQVLEMRVLDLGAVVADTEKMLRRLIGEDVEVVVVKPATLGRVKADPGQLEQVLVNLAVNSRDAMPGGGRLTLELADVTLDAPFTTSHDSIPPGRYVVVAVRDTGSGMDAETLGHLFEPFFTTKEKGKGTGLGLATVFGIVKQSGGYVDVASAPGAGTTFRVYLPRTDARTTSGARPPVFSLSGWETVLLVEDEAAVRNLVRAVLERKGYVVLVAPDGAVALDLVDKHTGVIHVLLTDIVMPGMSGRDLAAAVRARRPSIKVIFMSGYTADVPTDLGTEGGPVFLPKPFNEYALTSKLREVLDTPGPERSPTRS
jgi:PAS domain S-box-containing protein